MTTVINGIKSSGNPSCIYTLTMSYSNRTATSVYVSWTLTAKLSNTYDYFGYSLDATVYVGGHSETKKLKGTEKWQGTTSHSISGGFTVSGLSNSTSSISTALKVSKGSTGGDPDNACALSKTSGSNLPISQWTSYTVSYNANGGSGAPSSQTKWKDQTLTLSSTKPTRTGYTFLGWALSKSEADAGNWYYSAGATCGKNENLTLYAVWKINTYTVKFVNGLGTTLKTQTVNHGSNATPPANPKRNGYTFTGWSGSYTNVTSNRTITATWTINKYYLTLNGKLDGYIKNNLDDFGTVDVYVNGSLISNDCSSFHQDFNYGSSYSIQDIKVKQGYTYIGDSQYSGTIDIGDVTVELNFTSNQYNITYNGNGGLYQNSPTFSEKVKYKSNYITRNNNNFFVREGYTFVGWNERPDGIGTDWTSWIDKPQQYPYPNDVTLYAQWERNVYDITFDANGGVVDAIKNKIPSQFESMPEYINYNVDINTNGVYSKYGEGTSFPGSDIWIGANIKKDTKYFIELTFHHDVTFYSSQSNNIRFDKNNEYAKTNFVQVNSNKWVGEIIAPINTSAIAISPYMQWNENRPMLLLQCSVYELTEGNIAIKKVEHGGLLTDIPTATRNNYLFLGWYTSKTDGTKLDTSIPIKNNTIYYARWVLAGVIYIDNGNTFNKYQIYIDNGHSWDLYVPYIDDGLDWKILA